MSDRTQRNVQLPPEQQAIEDKCYHPTGMFEEFFKEEVEQSIPDRFEKIVSRYPDRLAVKTKGHELTYQMLNQAANCVAQAILKRHGKAPKPIALLLDNDAPIITAILGVLKAGKIYVPLDASYPHARLFSILENSQAGLILTDTKNLSLAKDLLRFGCRAHNIDELDFNLSAEAPGLSISPDSPANILYTSGSTGQPKGVIQLHRNVLHEIMNYTNKVHICAADRLILLSSPSFADAVRTIYGAILNGAGLYPIDLKQQGFVPLADWLTQQRITIYRSVPSVFRQFVNALTGKEEFADLRLIYSAGDSVSWTDIELYKRHFPSNCIFINGLGSTESLTFRWYFIDKKTPTIGAALPVGYAVEDKSVLLLDDQGNEVGFNEIGQMAVRSRYLSPGYWNKPDLTQAAFRPGGQESAERTYLSGDMGRMLPDGCLMHLGRRDFQVKIRGQRIEFAEIEMALLNLDAIKEAVVVGREDRGGNQRLIAYLVSAKQQGPTVSSIRCALAERLPGFMIPSSYVWLDALPLNPNKKVDRRALADPDNSRPELDTPFIAARNPLEEQLVQIWADILGIDQVGIHDNFFDLGGHSLTATQVVSRVIKSFQLELPLKALFESPTVADMAKIIKHNQARKASDGELERILTELEAMSEKEAKKLLPDESARSVRRGINE